MNTIKLTIVLEYLSNDLDCIFACHQESLESEKILCNIIGQNPFTLKEWSNIVFMNRIDQSQVLKCQERSKETDQETKILHFDSQYTCIIGPDNKLMSVLTDKFEETEVEDT